MLRREFNQSESLSSLVNYVHAMLGYASSSTAYHLSKLQGRLDIALSSDQHACWAFARCKTHDMGSSGGEPLGLAILDEELGEVLRLCQRGSDQLLLTQSMSSTGGLACSLRNFQMG